MICLDQKHEQEFNGIYNGTFKTGADYFNRAILHTAI